MEFDKRKDKYITLEIVLLALLQDNSEVAKIFKSHGINEKTLLEVVNKLRQGKTADTDTAESSYQALEKFTKNITKLILAIEKNVLKYFKLQLRKRTRRMEEF